MIDLTTRGNIRVSNDGSSGPYIIVPVEQLEKIESLLREAHISYWVDINALSVNGRPEITVINLGRDAEDQRVQQLLDQVH